LELLDEVGGEGVGGRLGGVHDGGLAGHPGGEGLLVGIAVGEAPFSGVRFGGVGLDAGGPGGAVGVEGEGVHGYVGFGEAVGQFGPVFVLEDGLGYDEGVAGEGDDLAGGGDGEGAPRAPFFEVGAGDVADDGAQEVADVLGVEDPGREG